MNMHESVTGGTVLKAMGTQDTEASHGVQFSLNDAILFPRSIKKSWIPYSAFNAAIPSEGQIESHTSPL